jgi:16S rRNA (adenine1518-N6/adenine1519-N6)-dimethyltransferase
MSTGTVAPSRCVMISRSSSCGDATEMHRPKPRAAARPLLPPPRKRLGQHFLHDGRVLDAIADALGDLSAATVVEIGPGRGALTDRLVERAARVIAIELDRDLVPVLEARFRGRANVEIVAGDALQVAYGALAGGPYVLAGNVPYYITTPLLFHGLEAPRALRAVYLVQREVAERAAAAPGSRIYGALSVNLQALATVDLVRVVSPRAFTPPPTVESAVMTVVPRGTPAVPPALEQRFRTTVLAAFALRRKQMLRVVRTVTGLGPEEALSVLVDAAIDPHARPETLSSADFARLVARLAPA